MEFGLGPLLPVKGNCNASAYQDILDNAMLPTLREQFGEGPFLFQHDSTCKQGLLRHGWMSLVWKNSTGPHKALTLTPSNTFGMNWNGDCEPGFLVQQCLTSQMHYWMNAQKFQQKHLVESLPKRVEAVIAAKGDQLYVNVCVFRMQCD